jgi:hypothetical protein
VTRRRGRRRRPKPRPRAEPIELLTPRELAAKLGWTDDEAGERLKRVVFAAERQLQVEIFVREGTAEHTVYKGTMPALRKWIPQLFDRSKVDDLASNLRGYLSKLEEQLDDTVADKFAEDVEPRLRRIRSEIEGLRKLVNDVDSRLKLVERRG